MSTTHKQTLEKANAAVAKGDIEGFLRYCTEDTTWVFEGEQTLRGKEAVRAYMKKTYVEPPRFDMQRMIEEGDFLAVLGEITLKDEAGKDVRHPYCDVWRFRDGAMAELRAYVVPAGRDG